jgi:nucleoside-diphosphate-sugar epimerase
MARGVSGVRAFTIFGAKGFVGRHLCASLEQAGHPVIAVNRGSWPEPGSRLGHVIYTIGMTADFRQQPFDTIRNHVSFLTETLEKYSFDSFLYLSTTRVYRGSETTDENVSLSIRPGVPDDLYNASKLAGETLCLALANPEIRVARLSNLYGAGASPSFLASVLEEARHNRRVTLRTGPGTAKDYLDIEAATCALINIARSGQQRLYNVAAGENVRNDAIMEALAGAGIPCDVEPGSPEPIFPPIEISRLRAEFPHHPQKLALCLPGLLAGLPPLRSIP